MQLVKLLLKVIAVLWLVITLVENDEKENWVYCRPSIPIREMPT